MEYYEPDWNDYFLITLLIFTIIMAIYAGLYVI
jgi:hypothetical protein